MREIGAKANEHMELAGLFKYMELLLKIECNPETSSMYRFRLNKVCSKIEELLEIPRNDQE